MNDDERKRHEAERAMEEATLLLKQLEEKAMDEALNRTAEPPLCSFCGKGINQVRRMIEGKQGYICDSCIKTLGTRLTD